jgi:hypothetical protein
MPRQRGLVPGIMRTTASYRAALACSGFPTIETWPWTIGGLGRALSRAFRDDPLPEDPPAALFPRGARVYGWIVALSVINFLCFVVVAVTMGGDTRR